jgi:hypothetical protein
VLSRFDSGEVFLGHQIAFQSIECPKGNRGRLGQWRALTELFFHSSWICCVPLDR